jgi:ABC-2 type transport system permease protein
MREIALIINSSLRSNMRLKVTIAVSVAVVLICIIGLFVAFCLLLITPAVQTVAPDIYKLETYLSLIIYAVCLIGLGVNMNAFAFQTMTREKSRGHIEALLATPLKASHIWIAKSLAVFLPGLVLGEILALLSLLLVNYIYFIPKTGFLLTLSIAVTGFVAVPLVYLSISLLVHLIGLTGKPATGNVIVQVFLPVFAALMINLGVRGVLDATSWQFTLVNLSIALIISGIALLLRPRLTSERIVLSR